MSIYGASHQRVVHSHMYGARKLAKTQEELNKSPYILTTCLTDDEHPIPVKVTHFRYEDNRNGAYARMHVTVHKKQMLLVLKYFDRKGNGSCILGGGLVNDSSLETVKLCHWKRLKHAGYLTHQFRHRHPPNVYGRLRSKSKPIGISNPQNIKFVHITEEDALERIEKDWEPIYERQRAIGQLILSRVNRKEMGFMMQRIVRFC